MPPLFPSPACLPRRGRPVRRHGFTLIELLTVVAIVAILAGISLGVLRGVNDRAAVATARAELAMLAQGLEAFKGDYGTYPVTAGLTSGDSCAKHLYRALNGLLTMANGTATSEYNTNTSGRRYMDNAKFTLKLKEDAIGDAPPDAENMYIDPWGRGYRYYYNPAASKTGKYMLFSLGANGGNTTKAADVTNESIKAGERPVTGTYTSNIYLDL